MNGESATGKSVMIFFLVLRKLKNALGEVLKDLFLFHFAEENFFGPVSSSFIRSGRLSDSAASDDNHDITMDSTAFSMHFRSLVRSESGDLKTPTGKTFAFEEKTPTHVSTSSDPGSFMVLTKAKKPIGQSPVAVGKVTGSRDSNDMSLVGDDSHRYDYGRLSPALEALLAESGENILVDSLFDSAADTKSLKKSEVPIFNDVGSGSLDKKDNSSSDMHDVGFDDVYAEEVPMAHSSSGESNGGSMATVTDLITHDCPSSRIDYLVSDAPAGDHIQSPNQPNNVRTSPACRKVICLFSIVLQFFQIYILSKVDHLKNFKKTDYMDYLVDVFSFYILL